MILSVNEIEMTMRKAALACGWAFGVAEEFGSAARWIVMSGIGDFESLLSLAIEGPQMVHVVKSTEEWKFQGSGAAEAVSAFDVLACGTVTKIRMNQVSWVEGLLGLAGAAAMSYGMEYKFSSSVDGSDLAAVRSDRGRIYVPRFHEVSDVFVHVTPLELTGAQRDSASGYEVNKLLWNRVEALAARTYVPSTLQSRESGAGARISDNE